MGDAHRLDVDLPRRDQRDGSRVDFLHPAGELDRQPASPRLGGGQRVEVAVGDADEDDATANPRRGDGVAEAVGASLSPRTSEQPPCDNATMSATLSLALSDGADRLGHGAAMRQWITDQDLAGAGRL